MDRFLEIVIWLIAAFTLASPFLFAWFVIQMSNLQCYSFGEWEWEQRRKARGRERRRRITNMIFRRKDTK